MILTLNRLLIISDKMYFLNLKQQNSNINCYSSEEEDTNESFKLKEAWNIEIISA